MDNIDEFWSQRKTDRKKAAAHAVSFKALERSDINRQEDDMMNNVNLALDLVMGNDKG